MSKSFERLRSELTAEEVKKFLRYLRYRLENISKCDGIRNPQCLQMRLISCDWVQDDYVVIMDDDEKVSMNYRFCLDLYDAIGEKRYRAVHKKLGNQKIYINFKRLDEVEKKLNICKDFESGMSAAEVARKHGLTVDNVKKIKKRYGDKSQAGTVNVRSLEEN